MSTVDLATQGRAATDRTRASVLAPEVASALSQVAGADLRVTVDLAVRRGPGRVVRLRSRQGVHRQRVTSVTTAFTGVVEVARLDLASWPDELARTVTVPEAQVGPGPSGPDLLVPWALLVGSGAARARHRPELYDALLARATGSCRAGDRDLGLPECHEVLRRLRSATGRMRAVGAGPFSPPRLGWVTWLLLDDGWHALSPTVRDGRPMVVVAARRPPALAVDAARWLAAVRR